MTTRCFGFALFLLSAGVHPAMAQLPGAPTPAPTPAPAAEAPAETEKTAPDSPRASLQAYLDAGRAGRWEEAARYLSLNADQRGRGAELAERLKAVLDEHLWFDLETISPDSDGRRDDGLSARLEEVGQLTLAGQTERVRLVRASDREGQYWAFSPATVARIDAWYATLGDRRWRDFLVWAGLDALLRPGPFEILWWQWIALPLVLFVSWELGRALGSLTRVVLRRLTAHTRGEWDDRFVGCIGPPLALAWASLLFWLTLPALQLTVPARAFLQSLVTTAVVITLFWALWRSARVFAEQALTLPWAAGSASTRSLLMVGSNLARGAILLMGALAVLSALGFPVGTLLAGLGIGGLALAFGAQKTIENLFGSISLAIDQPFRVDDFVKVNDFVGNVEEIGLRSTRFRTLDRTLITIPNGQLAEWRLESFSARDRMRLAATIGVEYGTTEQQMQAVLEGFERVLRAHPRIWPDAMVVKFKEFGASSLDIEIMAWFQVPTWAEFQQCRQEVLLGFMKVVEEAGTSFAFPTRTVHLVNAERQGDGASAGPS
jgi:MscS family membrane protein